MALFKRLKIELYHPATPGNTLQRYLQNHVYHWVLFVIPRKWNYPRCPLIDKWMIKYGTYKW